MRPFRHPPISLRFTDAKSLVAAAVIVLLSFFGCDSFRMYFHEASDGSRYYETKNGEVLRVTPEGSVYKGGERIGKASMGAVYTEGTLVRDWNLTPFEVVPPSGHCASLFEEDLQPVPCWTQLYEVPFMVVAAPVAAVYNLFARKRLTVPDGETNDPSHVDHRTQ